MRDRPFVVVEGTGDFKEALLLLTTLPPGETAGLELLRLKRPMVDCRGKLHFWWCGREGAGLSNWGELLSREGQRSRGDEAVAGVSRSELVPR
jgi:hypothetical protein